MLSILLLAAAVNASGATIAPQQKDRCEIHSLKMKSVDLPVDYGLPPPYPGWTAEKMTAYGEARPKSFPHAARRLNGGCMPDPAVKTRKEFVCEKCLKEKKKWLREHKLEAYD